MRKGKSERENQKGKIRKGKSETALDNWDFDFIINNDSSIEDLIKKVKDTIEDYIFKN